MNPVHLFDGEVWYHWGGCLGWFGDEAVQKHQVARQSRAEDFGKLLSALAAAYGLRQAWHVVVSGDGAPWIWKLAAQHCPGAVQIVDLWHALAS